MSRSRRPALAFSGGVVALATMLTATLACDPCAQAATAPRQDRGAAERKQPPAGRAPAPDSRVRIASPADGTVFPLGTGFEATIVLAPSLTERQTVRLGIVGLGDIDAKWIGGTTFRVAVPAFPYAGAFDLMPEATDTAGVLRVGAKVSIAVVAPASPLTMVQSQFGLPPGSGPQQLYVQGRLADGNVTDLRSHLTGTTYSSSDPSVLTVDADGLVTVVGVGEAHVTARNRGYSALASFIVADPAHPPPAKVLTSNFQITRSLAQFDVQSGFDVQQVSIRNVGAWPALVPLHLVLSDLPAGVKMVEPSGLTMRSMPLGRPYLTVRPLTGEGLSIPSGATMRYTFRFTNPARVAITYRLDVIGANPQP